MARAVKETLRRNKESGKNSRGDRQTLGNGAVVRNRKRGENAKSILSKPVVVFDKVEGKLFVTERKLVPRIEKI